jgi:hypothetical protein
MDLERIMEENQKKIQEQQKKMVSLFKLPLLVPCGGSGSGSGETIMAHKKETFLLDGDGGFF